MVSGAETMGGALVWWRADPASDIRTRVVCLSWVFLPALGLAMSAAGSPARPSPDPLPRARAGGGVLRNQRLRIR